MNWKHYAVVGLLVLLALWRIDNLQGKLKLERSEHQTTKEALAVAVEKGNGWKAAYETANGRAEANREAAQACLDREVEARAASEEREAILQASPLRARTETEQTQVVGNETRKRTADRLNRPL